MKLYDPESGRPKDLERLIWRLGIRAVAAKYDVSESTIRKWVEGVHRPSRKTVTKSLKKLF